MKVIIDGHEEELIDKLEPGEKELDMLTLEDNNNNNIDIEDTIELTEDMLKELISRNEFNE